MDATEIAPISPKRKLGRPKIAPDEKMEMFAVQVPRMLRKNLDLLSVRCDKSVSQLAREAFALFIFVHEKGESE